MLTDWQRIGSGSPGVELRGQVAGEEVVCIVNMARYFSSLRALLVVLRNCDPLLYQYVDGGGFFTSHGQPNKQVRLVWYIYAQRYRDHHDDEFIRRCERVRRQFILTSALCGLVVVSLIALMIWH